MKTIKIIDIIDTLVIAYCEAYPTREYDECCEMADIRAFKIIA